MTRTTSAPNLDSGFISRSHQAIRPFKLERPTRAEDAATLIADGALAHAGGIDTVSALRLGQRTEQVVDLGAIEELGQIERTDTHLQIGATVTHALIESDPVVTATRPDLAAAWRTVGNVRIRRAGTVGGNLMAFSPEYDGPPILAAAGATLVFIDGNGEHHRTSVADCPGTGLLLRIEVPLVGRVVFDRSLKPVATVAVGDAQLAIGCAHPETVVVSRDQGTKANRAIPEPTDDAVASSTYRRRMIEVLIARVEAAHAEGATE